MKPIYEVIYEEMTDGDVYGISPVDKPATELEFIALSKFKVELKAGPKQILYGVVLRPDQLIDRGDFDIRFSAEVIERFAHDFLIKGYQKNAAYNHEDKLDDVCVVENWIVEDPQNDKATALGLRVQKGDWVIGQKLGDESWKEYIESGKATGFSIDSLIQFDKINMSANSPETVKKINIDMNLIKRILRAINLAEIEVDGNKLTADAFEVGNTVYNDDLSVFAGEFDHEGKHFVTDEFGVIVTAEVKEEEAVEVEMEDVEVDAPAEEEIVAVVEEIIAEIEADVVEVPALEEKVAELEELIEKLTEENEEVLRENARLKKAPMAQKMKANPITMKKITPNSGSALSVIERLNKKK